jgi:hypothetical protein
MNPGKALGNKMAGSINHRLLRKLVSRLQNKLYRLFTPRVWPTPFRPMLTGKRPGAFIK